MKKPGSLPKTPIVWMLRPWIEDFSAYDQFSQPAGFLKLASQLMELGCEVHYLDCLSRANPGIANLRSDDEGSGEYVSQAIPKPSLYDGIPRRYKRYGIGPDAVREHLLEMQKPDVILLTASMTYWYPAVRSLIHLCREISPGSALGVGGIYPTISMNHARNTLDADYVHAGFVDGAFWDWMCARTALDKDKVSGLPAISDALPAWNLAGELAYGVVTASWGCSCKCRYCGASRIVPEYRQRSLAAVLREIDHLAIDRKIKNIAFQDDDLGCEQNDHFEALLDAIAARNYSASFYLPNAITALAITRPIAGKLIRCGFVQPRLSLPQMDRRISASGLDAASLGQFARAAENLRDEGYRSEMISMYLIAGIEGQKLSWLEKSGRQLLSIGIKPYLAQFSPVPGTPLGDERLKSLGFEQNGDLLLTNKILSVYRHIGWTGAEYQNLAASFRRQRDLI